MIENDLCGPVMPPKSKRVRQSLEAAAKGREVLEEARTDFETESGETVPTTTNRVSKIHVDTPPRSMAGFSHVTNPTSPNKFQKSC